MNKAFHCIAIYTKKDSEDNESGITTDIHLCDSKEEAIEAIKAQAKMNQPDFEITFTDAKELDMEHLVKDWLDGKRTGKNYYIYEDES